MKFDDLNSACTTVQPRIGCAASPAFKLSLNVRKRHILNVLHLRGHYEN